MDMEKITTPEESRLEILQQTISNSPEAIESEFARTQNSWMACLGSRIFIIETYSVSSKLEEEVGKEKVAEILNKLEILKEKHYKFKFQYPEKDSAIPDEVKRELLEDLNVL
ncbi:MAG: hypothetical protein V4690_03825 [Patescibacteria group bacterium]